MSQVVKLMKMDFLKSKSLGKIWIFSLLPCIFFIAVPIFRGVTSIFFLYAWIYMPISYDEQNAGESLLWNLPVSKWQMVVARYLYSFIGLVFSVIIQTIGNIIFPSFLGQFFSDYPTQLVSSSLDLMVGVVFIALILPVIFRLGVLKSRYYIMGIYIIGIVTMSVISTLIKSFSEVHFSIGVIAILLITVLVLSFRLSLRFYEKREL